MATSVSAELISAAARTAVRCCRSRPGCLAAITASIGERAVPPVEMIEVPLRHPCVEWHGRGAER